MKIDSVTKIGNVYEGYLDQNIRWYLIECHSIYRDTVIKENLIALHDCIDELNEMEFLAPEEKQEANSFLASLSFAQKDQLRELNRMKDEADCAYIRFTETNTDEGEGPSLHEYMMLHDGKSYLPVYFHELQKAKDFVSEYTKEHPGKLEIHLFKNQKFIKNILTVE